MFTLTIKTGNPLTRHPIIAMAVELRDSARDAEVNEIVDLCNRVTKAWTLGYFRAGTLRQLDRWPTRDRDIAEVTKIYQEICCAD